MDMEQRLGDARSPRKLEQGRIGPSSGASGGSVSPPTRGPGTPGLDSRPPEPGEKKLLLFSVVHEGPCIPAAPGDQLGEAWPRGPGLQRTVTGCVGWTLNRVSPPPVPRVPVRPWPRALGAGPSPHSDSDTVLRPRHPVCPPRCPPSSAPACSLPSPPLLPPLPCLPLPLYSAGGHVSACSPPQIKCRLRPRPRRLLATLPEDRLRAAARLLRARTPGSREHLCALVSEIDFALSAQHSPLPRAPLLRSRILCVAPPEGRLLEGRGLAVSLPAVPQSLGPGRCSETRLLNGCGNEQMRESRGTGSRAEGRPEGPPGRDAASPSPLLPRSRTAALADGHRRWAPASPRATWRAGGRATRAAEPPPRAAGPRPWPCPLVSQGVRRGRGPSRRSEAGQRPGGGKGRGGGLLLLGPRPSALPHLCTGPSQPHPFPSARGLLSPVGT